MNTDQKIKIVTIGGGSGQYVLLSALRDLGHDITSVVSMTDSGGSTGRLRDELGVLPPGDILKCIVALSAKREYAREVFQTRFDESDDRKLAGHNAGNLFLSFLSDYVGNFPVGVQALSKLLAVQGRVFPVTIDRATLVAELEDGTRLFGESAIDIPRGDRAKIKEVFLVPHHKNGHENGVEVYPPVIEAILAADFVVLGPGDLFSSIMPNLKVPGVREALVATRAKLVYIVNIMTKYGETHRFDLSDFISEIETAIGRPLDIVIANSALPSQSMLDKYKKENAEPVLFKAGYEVNEKKIILRDVIDESGDILRHNEKKLADIFLALTRSHD
ncbi:MAG: uridine diphosphate-N-acetylglucosamine-binding protein YvcK [Candidatus Falkowbacteria bacterium]